MRDVVQAALLGTQLCLYAFVLDMARFDNERWCVAELAHVLQGLEDVLLRLLGSIASTRLDILLLLTSKVVEQLLLKIR